MHTQCVNTVTLGTNKHGKALHKEYLGIAAEGLYFLTTSDIITTITFIIYNSDEEHYLLFCSEQSIVDNTT